MALTMKPHRIALRSLAAAPVLLLAHMEGALATDPPPADQAMLQPIVVTATRHETTVQATPISIQAFTAAQIAATGLVDVDSLVRAVPDIAVRNTGGPGEMEFEIRGLNSQGGNSSMVGMYLDDIPLSTAMGSQLGKDSMDPGLYDLERVEVLSGPQGTLYGSSSMGGTVRLIPNKPRLNTYEASAEEVLSDTISGGGINHRENAMMNLPVGDTAALRVVGSFTADSGWIKRLVLADGAVPIDTGVFPAVQRPSNFYSAPLQTVLNGVNTTRIDSIRAEFLWQPTENLTIEPTALYQSTLQAAPPTVDVNGSPAYPQMPAVKAHYEIYDSPEPQQDIMSLGSLKTVYQLPAFSLTSATGFWHRNFIDLQDSVEQNASAIGIPAYDAAAGGLGPNVNSKGAGTLEQDSSRQISEEFRVTSTAPGPIQWVAGYFYQDLHSEDAIAVMAPQATPIFGGPNLFLASIPEILVQNAFYAHLSWRLSEHFEVAAGLRRYHYSLTDTSTQVGAFSALAGQGNNVPLNTSAAVAASGTVPSFTLTYNIDRDHMVYARIGKGFRLGGPELAPIPVVAASNTNPLLASEVANECALQAKLLLTATCNPNIFLQPPTTFGSDWLWSYELGEKSSFFQHRLIANLDAYLEDWYNPQMATDVAGFYMMANGGNGRIKGVDGQLQALLPGGLDLSLNASYIDATFVESSAITGFPAGTRIPDTPRLAGSAALQWQHDLADGLTLLGSLEEAYSGARTDLPFGVTATLQNINQVLVHLPAYSIANLRFGVRGERNDGDRWTAMLFVNNFTNNQVLLDPQPQIALQTAAYARYVVSQPLTAGIDVSYQFH
jgi:iron complex outermembrane receptor protein